MYCMCIFVMYTGSPSDARINVYPDGNLSEEDFVTLSCNATTRTLPLFAARNLVFTWKRLNTVSITYMLFTYTARKVMEFF